MEDDIEKSIESQIISADQSVNAAKKSLEDSKENAEKITATKANELKAEANLQQELANTAIDQGLKAAETAVDDQLRTIEKAFDDKVKTANKAVEDKLQEANKYADAKRQELTNVSYFNVLENC